MRKVFGVALTLLLGLTACEDFASPTGAPGGPSPTGGDFTLQKISGDDQTGAPGTELPDPYVVKVVDQFGGALPDRTVRFRVQEGNGGSISSSSVVTDAEGNAVVTARLPNTINVSQTVIAEMDSAQNSVSFTSRTTSQLSGAANIRIISGDDQKGITKDTLLDPLVVEVTNEDGVALEGVSVKWRVVSKMNSVRDSGGAALDDPTVTDADGIAQTRWRLGDVPQSTDSLIAFIEPQDADPDTVMFTAFVTGVPDTIVVTQGGIELDNDFNEPELLVGDTVFVAENHWSRKPFKAIVIDAAGDSVRGAELSWTVTSGSGNVGDEPEGGSAETVTVVTDEDGGITVWRKAANCEDLSHLDDPVEECPGPNAWIGATLSIERFPEVTPVTLNALIRN